MLMLVNNAFIDFIRAFDIKKRTNMLIIKFKTTSQMTSEQKKSFI